MSRDLEFHQLELRYGALRIARAESRQRLLASLAQHGQQSPVLVVPVEGEGERFVLIDGYQRVWALERLGHDTVRALVLPWEAAPALCQCYRQETARRRSVLEESWLVQELAEGPGWDGQRIARELGRTAGWVSRRLAIPRVLPAVAEELVRTGQLPAHGVLRALVPLARANREACERVCAGLGTARLSSRELQRLYRAWKVAAPEERTRIEAHPRLYLEAEAAARGPPVEGPRSDEEKLRNDLEVLGAVARRAAARLGRARGLVRPSHAPLPLVFDGVWSTTWEALLALQGRMEARLHAGPRATNRDLRAEPTGPRGQEDRPHAEGVAQHGAPGAA